jgi:fatty acid synthase subunit beta
VCGAGVGPFRSYLKSRLDNKIDLSLLEHQYIPNLTAVPFVVSREYFDLIMAMTDSAELKQVRMVP